MGGGIVNAVCGDLCWPGGFGWRPGLLIPEAKVIKDYFYNHFVLYDTEKGISDSLQRKIL